MKTIFFVCTFISCACFVIPYVVFAQSAAQDWTWTYTKATDYDGNVLAQQSGPAEQPLTFSTSPSMYAVYFYGTLYSNQALNSGNIDFVGAGSNLEGLGAGSSGYFQSYNPSLFQPSELNSKLPIVANSATDFWYFTSYRPGGNAIPGDYRVFESDINIYDLTEPVDQWGYRPLHSISATNDVRWTVTPEPISSALFLLGAVALGSRSLLRKKRKV